MLRGLLLTRAMDLTDPALWIIFAGNFMGRRFAGRVASVPPTARLCIPFHVGPASRLVGTTVQYESLRTWLNRRGSKGRGVTGQVATRATEEWLVGINTRWRSSDRIAHGWRGVWAGLMS